MNDERNSDRPDWVCPHANDPAMRQGGFEHNPVAQIKQNELHAAQSAGGFFSRAWYYIFHTISMVGHVALTIFESVPHLLRLFKKGSLGKQIGVSSVIVVIVALSVCYYLMGWRALPINHLKAQIAAELVKGLGVANVSIGEALLQRDTYRGGFYVRLTKLRLSDRNGTELAHCPEMAIGLKTLPMLIGSFEPDSLDLIAPTVHLVRNAQGEWRFWRDDGVFVDEKDHKPITRSETIQLQAVGDIMREGLREAHRQLAQEINLSYVGLRDAKLVLHRAADEPGDVWLVPAFTVKYDLDRENRLIGSGILQRAQGEGAKAWLSLAHKEGDEFIEVESELQNIVPSELSSLVPVLEALQPVKVGVSGRLQARVNLVSGLESGVLNVELSSGTIELFGTEGLDLALESGEFEFTMEQGAKHIVMRNGDLRYQSGRMSLKGDIWQQPGDDDTPEWKFQIAADEGEIYATSIRAKKINVDQFRLSGRLFSGALPIHIDEMIMRAGEMTLNLAHFNKPDFGYVVKGTASSIPAEVLLRVWPDGYEAETRQWIAENVKSGVISRVSYQLEEATATLAPKAKKIAQSLLPEIEAEIEDVSFTVLNDPLLMVARQALFKVRGRSLSVESSRMQADVRGANKLGVSNAKMTIADYWPDVPDAEFKFDVDSDALTMLELMQHDPFNYKAKLGSEVKGLAGDISGRIEMSMPLGEGIQKEDVKLRGAVKLAKGRAEIGKFKISSGLVNFDVGEKFIDAKGNILINGVSAAVAWQSHLSGEKNTDDPIVISGTYDEADRNQLGLNINHVVQGGVPVAVSIGTADNGEAEWSVAANLTDAVINADALGWRKEKGRLSSLNFTIVADKDKRFRLNDFQVKGDDLTMRGTLELDDQNRPVAFDFPDISYKVLSNVSFKGVLDKHKIWRITGSGQTYDGRGILKKLLRTGQIGASPKKIHSRGFDLRAEFDNVVGWKQSKLAGFKIKMKRRSRKLTSLNASGELPRGGKLIAKLVSKRGEDPVIQVETSDAGEAMRFVGFYPNMLGGNGILKVKYNDKNRQLASKTGRLSIRRFAIASDPVVKEVLANVAQKKNKSKAGSQTQDRIAFSRLDAPFSIGQEQFVLHDSNVKGELLGATMRGRIDFGREQVRLSGTYIPLYGLNAAVGAVPLLGDILVGRQGEGILGITFGIYGNLQQPEVLVNPMSVIAPGVFRQIFEFEQGQQNIKVRAEGSNDAKHKLDSSASKPQRGRKVGSDVKRKPEASASNVMRGLGQ